MTRPFDDIRALFEQFPARGAAPDAQTGSAELAALLDWIKAWRGEAKVSRPVLCLYAGAHACGDIGPIRARMEAVASGDAAVNRAAQHLGAGLDVFDLALERPVGDRTKGAAMSERECAATMAFGMEALAKQPDLLILMGAGPGADDAAAVLAQTLAGDASHPAAARAASEAGGDPLELLRQLGGRETAALAGAILAARIQGVPVLLDGVPALAAAAVLQAVQAQAISHCRVAHAAPGAEQALAIQLGRSPVVGLQQDDEAGTAAMAALALVKLALATAP